MRIFIYICFTCDISLLVKLFKCDEIDIKSAFIEFLNGKLNITKQNVLKNLIFLKDFIILVAI